VVLDTVKDGWNVQPTKQKHNRNAKLAHRGKMELPNHWNRNQENQCVGDKVRDGQSVHHQESVDAFHGYLLGRYGGPVRVKIASTSKDESQCEPEIPDDYDGYHGVDDQISNVEKSPLIINEDSFVK
jgi:hypothetical protein